MSAWWSFAGDMVDGDTIQLHQVVTGSLTESKFKGGTDNIAQLMDMSSMWKIPGTNHVEHRNPGNSAEPPHWLPNLPLIHPHWTDQPTSKFSRCPPSPAASCGQRWRVLSNSGPYTLNHGSNQSRYPTLRKGSINLEGGYEAFLGQTLSAAPESLLIASSQILWALPKFHPFQVVAYLERTLFWTNPYHSDGCTKMFGWYHIRCLVLYPSSFVGEIPKATFLDQIHG